MNTNLVGKLLLSETCLHPTATKQVSKIITVIHHTIVFSLRSCTKHAQSLHMQLARSDTMLILIDQLILSRWCASSFSQGVITMQIHWLWLAMGLIPYTIKRKQSKDEKLV